MSLVHRITKAWNVFTNRPEENGTYRDTPESYIGGSNYKPDRVVLTSGNERSIVNSIYNRIAIDVASISVRHVRLDENDRFKEHIKSGLDSCLTVEANKDQTGRELIQDIVVSMLDEGVVAVVPVDTTHDPNQTESYTIKSLRVAKVLEWFPDHVRVELYNDRQGRKDRLLLRKDTIAIIQNPLYNVINQPNSIAKRLVRKLNILDVVDEQSGSGKLDLIIQLPYAVKNQTRRDEAALRQETLERQLTNSKYGVAYMDATEKVIQLNRPVNNNLMTQIEYLTRMLYGQLGIDESVMNGTADDVVMLNYNTRTVEPIISAIVNEMTRKYISPTARTQKQVVHFFRDPFRVVPVSQIAEIADKFTRNEILTSNEVRGIVGFKPSKDTTADELRNKNLSVTKEDRSNVAPSSGGPPDISNLLQQVSNRRKNQNEE